MANIAPLKVFTVAARAEHTATVIFIHGLGDSGAGWRPIATMFGSLPEFKHVKWILPTACTSDTRDCKHGKDHAFLVRSLDFANAPEDEAGMLRTVGSLNRLISDEVDAGIPSERIVIGGFSQGGTMSLLTGLTTERKLGGIVVMSGRLPIRDKIQANDHAKNIPIFWGHGINDPLVTYVWAQQCTEFLKTELGIGPVSGDSPAGVEFHGYPGLSHSANDDEFKDFQIWLQKALPA